MTAPIEQVKTPARMPSAPPLAISCLAPWLRRLGLGLLLVSQVPAAIAADWFFTLRPTETTEQLALRCCGDATIAEKIMAYNNIDMRYPPVVGSRLKVPVDWLQTQPAHALVLYVRGPVHDGAGQPLVAGDKVAMGGKVVTGKQGWTTVQFADQSTLQLGQQTEVLFDLLSAYGDSGMVDTLVRFAAGRGELRVIPSTTNRFRVATPTGIAAVRGTEFRVGAEVGKVTKTLLETTEGAVSLAAAGAAGPSVLVDAGYGAVADAQGISKEALLAAPTRLQVPAKPGSSLRASWAKIPKAGAYAVQLDQVTAGGLRLVDERLQRGNKARFENLTPGQYRVRVRGIAASGLQGLDAETQIQLDAAPPANTRWWPFSLLVIPLLLL